jgi:hypothetical protein
VEHDSTYVSLRVTDWIQTISNNSAISGSGVALRGHCFASVDYQLTLSTGEQLTKIPIQVDIVPGPVTRGNGQQLERGIGLFNYIRTEGVRPPSAIGCWIGLDREHYDELWAQVRAGAFSECEILLDLAPVPGPGEARWLIRNNSASLFVLGASISFSHMRRPPPLP